MEGFMDFDSLEKKLNSLEYDPKLVDRERRRKLFYAIALEWEKEEEIDYSTSVEELVDLMMDTSEYIEEEMKHREVISVVAERLLSIRGKGNTNRLL